MGPVGQDYDVLLAGDRVAALWKRSIRTVPPLQFSTWACRPVQTNRRKAWRRLSGLLALERTAKVIIISGQSEKENALRAVGAGAYDFFCKPIETRGTEASSSTLLLCRKPGEGIPRNATKHRGAEVVRRHVSARARRCRRCSPRFAKWRTSQRPGAFAWGERDREGDGGGGDSSAQLRKDGPFVAINCNAIPENLLESELFGHEKGSFTGAHMQRKGLIESAAKGTLFLDEIGDLPLPDPGEAPPVSSGAKLSYASVAARKFSADVRVIAATNADLKEAMSERKVSRGPLLSPGRRGASRCRLFASAETTSACWHGNFSINLPRKTAGRT